jgi:retron-type reverse transcriptase
VGKGTHRALNHCQQLARRYRYVLQGDIEQFFPAIDHQILHTILARKISDEQVMGLVDQILAGGAGILAQEYEMRWFPGDELWAVFRPRGLPIGNLTSQFWANCYLHSLDNFVQRGLGCSGYLRYVDDFALFANHKADLWRCRDAIVERLTKLRLTIHPGAQPRPVTEGIPFLGFVIYPEARRLKRRKGLFYRRRLKRLLSDYTAAQITLGEVSASVRGWVNHVRYGNTLGLRQTLFKELPIQPQPRL